MEQQRDRSRYDRSQYGSNSESRYSAGRQRDSFFEDMLITDEELDRTFGTPASARESDNQEELGGAGASDVEQGLPENAPVSTGAPNEQNPDSGSSAVQDAPLNDADRIARTYSRKSVEDRVAASAAASPKKRSSRKFFRSRASRVAAVVVLAVVLVGAGVGLAFVSGIAGNLHAGIGDDLRAVLVKTDMAKEPFYMLLLGTDGSAERDEDPDYGGGYRSDSMMLARIDPVKKKATLTSIGRDIQVDLGGEYGKQKINAAYAFGGPAMAVKAVSTLAGVPISHYAQVDFDGFAAMVDALGGVEVDVPMAIVDDWDAGGSVPGGLQTLDGAQALILCRARNSFAEISAHPDEMRAANQRLVLSAIARKLLASDVATIASTVSAMSSYVTTDLELTDIIGLAQIMKGLNPDTDIYTASVPTTSSYVNDIWYEFVDRDAWSTMMKRVEAGEPPVEEAVIDETTGVVLATAGAGATSSAEKQALVTVKNGTDIAGAASKVRTKLMDNGFVNVVIGDVAQGYKYPNTLVIYNEQHQAREAEEIVSCIGQGQSMLNDGSYLLLDSDFLVVIGDDWDTTK